MIIIFFKKHFHVDCPKTIRCLQIFKGTDKNVFLDRHCIKCIPGFYKSNDKIELCKKCPVGTFSEQMGSTFCFDCPPGSTTLAPGAYSWRNCTQIKDLGKILLSVSYHGNITLKCNTVKSFVQERTSNIEWLTLNPEQLVNKSRFSISKNGNLELIKVDETYNDVYKCHRYGRIDGRSFVLVFKIVLLVFVNILQVVEQVWHWKVEFCDLYDDDFFARLINTELCYKIKRPLGPKCLFSTKQKCYRNKENYFNDLQYNYKVTISVTYRHNQYTYANLEKHLSILNEVRDIFLQRKGHYENMISTAIDLPYIISRTCDPGYETNGQYCIPCMLGHFKPDQSTNRCAGCSLGSYQFKIGSTSCLNCPEGKTTINIGADRKSLCRPSTYNYRKEIKVRRGDLVLMKCARETVSRIENKYDWYYKYGEKRIKLFNQNSFTFRIEFATIGHSGTYECVWKKKDEFGLISKNTYSRELYVHVTKPRKSDCDVGTEYSDAFGSCVPCKKGYHRSATASNCEPCDIFSYQDKIGMSFCYKCPENRYVKEIASIYKWQCIDPSNATLTSEDVNILQLQNLHNRISSYNLNENKTKSLTKLDDKSCKTVSSLSSCRGKEKTCSLTCPLQGFYRAQYSSRKCPYGDLNDACASQNFNLRDCYSPRGFLECCLTCLKRSESLGLPYDCRFGDSEDCESKYTEKDCVISYNILSKKCCNYCRKLIHRVEYVWQSDTVKIPCIKMDGSVIKQDSFVWTSPDGSKISDYEEDFSHSYLDSMTLINLDGNLVIHRAKAEMSGTYECDALIYAGGRITKIKLSITLLVTFLPLPNVLLVLYFKVMQPNIFEESVRSHLESLREQACIKIRSEDFGVCPNRVVNIFPQLTEDKTLIVNLTISPLNRFRSIVERSADTCDKICRDGIKNRLRKHIRSLFRYFENSQIFSEYFKNSQSFQFTKMEANQNNMVYFCQQGYELINGTDGLTCSPCKPGWYSKELNLCHPCYDGSYQPKYGSNFCYHCLDDEITDRAGAINKDECFRF